MADKIFIKGINTFKRNEKAPDFVIGSGTINLAQFKEFVNSPEMAEHITEYKGQKQIKFQMLKQKDGEGKVNFVVDTYKPESQETKEEPNRDLPF